MPKLYIFMGNPGSGKTSVAKFIHELTGATHIWADRERQKLFAKPTHSVAESNELYEQLNRKAKRLLAAGHDVVFDTNFNYKKDRKHLRKLAASVGADVVVIQMTTPLALARERALAHDHADRNGMHHAMAPATFERINKHREPLSGDEPSPIAIRGENLTKADVRKALGL